MTEARVPVTDADRDAAGHLMRSLGEPERHISRFFDGELDHTDVVQAFAAHRLAGVAAGREEAAQTVEQWTGTGWTRLDLIALRDRIAAAIRQMGGE